mmetsp:Transcript_11414/g.28883  ORF Transcript_11414/g.28883 Transcript_11414/m.28883 type:complete len:234 (+) Transcript_11414:1-702(+)
MIHPQSASEKTQLQSNSTACRPAYKAAPPPTLSGRFCPTPSAASPPPSPPSARLSSTSPPASSTSPSPATPPPRRRVNDHPLRAQPLPEPHAGRDGPRRVAAGVPAVALFERGAGARKRHQGGVLRDVREGAQRYPREGAFRKNGAHGGRLRTRAEAAALDQQERVARRVQVQVRGQRRRRRRHARVGGVDGARADVGAAGAGAEYRAVLGAVRGSWISAQEDEDPRRRGGGW